MMPFAPIQATVVRVPNPFQPLHGREVSAVKDRQTLAEWADGNGIRPFKVPTMCNRNGAWIPESRWHEVAIQNGDVVTFVAIPHGGGGGGGGKNPMATVLMIAVMVAAPYIGSLVGNELALLAMGEMMGPATPAAIGLWGAAATGAFAIGGAVLTGALFPAPKPSMPSQSWGGFGSAPAPSPTYSLQAQGNQARLGQPIPEIFGRHRVFFDLCGDEYFEYVDNGQYLYQVFCVGMGHYEFEPLKIDDTPFSSFEEIQYQIVNPGQQVTLFHAAVVTASEVAGQEALGPNQLTAGDDGWLGPFIASGPATDTTHIGIDVAFSRGLYYAQNDGSLASKTVTWVAQAQKIDDSGAALGDWVVLGSESYTAATNTALRASNKYAIAGGGRYQVRFQRTNNNDQDSRTGHELRWSGLKAYLDEDEDPLLAEVTRVAVKAKATDNLSSRSSRLVNGVVTRKLPVWSPATGWSEPQATRDIAPALAYILRAENGAKLTDNRIDVAGLHQLHQTWVARGDTFNGVFDSTITAWEALIRVARVGRAAPFQQGGMVRVVRDEPRAMPSALFNGRNIVKGSFQIEYLMPGADTADAVTLEYWSEKTWATAEVTAARIGGEIRVLTPAELVTNPPERPAKVQYLGITLDDQAAREAAFLCAANIFRRRLPTFRTELDGLVLSYGDLVAVAHPMPSWGQGGEVAAWNPATRIMRLSEPVAWKEGQDHYIVLRKRDGGLGEPLLVEPAVGGDPKEVHVLDQLPFDPDTGGERERTYFALGPGDLWAQAVRVRAIKPRGKQVELVTVCEDQRVHVN